MARASRWREEEQLVKEEMRQVLVFLMWRAKDWLEKAHVYMTANGRISMAGLTTKNIRYFAESLDKVVRGQL